MRLLVYPVVVLGIGLVLLALERGQAVDWQTLTGAGLFAAGLLGAVGVPGAAAARCAATTRAT